MLRILFPAGQGVPEVKARGTVSSSVLQVITHRAGMERESRWSEVARPEYAGPLIKGYWPGASPALGSLSLLSWPDHPSLGPLQGAGCTVLDGSWDGTE